MSLQSLTFYCEVKIDKVRTKKGWNNPSCGGEKCKKGNLDRKEGRFWCDSCNSSVEYPVIRYRLDLEISDDTAEVVVVMFDETAISLLKCSASSIVGSESEVYFLALYNLTNTFTDLRLQDEKEHSGLPSALANILGTSHTLELKSHMYYEHGPMRASPTGREELEDSDAEESLLQTVNKKEETWAILLIRGKGKERGDGVAGIKRRRRDLSGDGVWILATVSQRDENPIRTLGDYSKPSHEGYRNTIELPIGNNVLAIGLNVFQQDPSPRGRILLLRNDILMFHQHHGESLSEAWTRFKDLLQKVPHHGIDHWLQDLAFYDNESWNDPRDFVKPVKAITLPQDVPSTSDHRLIELENQVQRLTEAHLTLTQPTQVNRITTPCEIFSGPHDTQYCMEDPKQAFVEYASSRTDEAGEGLVSNFMASQDARLSKFEADFKQQQNKMTNKIDTVLKAITHRIAGALPSDTVKNPKLSTSPVLSARSCPNMDPQCSNHIYGSINAVTIHSEQQRDSYDEKAKENEEEEKDSSKNIHVNPSTPPDPSVAFTTEKVLKFNSFFESLGLVPQSSDTEIVCTKGDDGEDMFIELIRKNDDSSRREPEEERSTTTEGRKLDPMENSNRGVNNFTGRINGMHVFIGNFTYNVDFMIVEDISSIIDPRLSQVVLEKPFVEISNITHDPPEGVVMFTNGNDEVAYKMPHKIE
ncbi:MAK10-like protein [Tanacetum coccineum]